MTFSSPHSSRHYWNFFNVFKELKYWFFNATAEIFSYSLTVCFKIFLRNQTRPSNFFQAYWRVYFAFEFELFVPNLSFSHLLENSVERKFHDSCPWHPPSSMSVLNSSTSASTFSKFNHSYKKLVYVDRLHLCSVLRKQKWKPAELPSNPRESRSWAVLLEANHSTASDNYWKLVNAEYWFFIWIFILFLKIRFFAFLLLIFPRAPRLNASE